MIQDIRLGTDVLDLNRLRQNYQRFGNRFFQKMLTGQEWAYCASGHGKNLIPRAGARIAAKEAISKALGVGMNGLGYPKGIHWHEVEVLSQYGIAPVMALNGKAQEIADSLGIIEWRVSFSHDGDYAMATVLGMVR
jgi:holo-[acyl-carrier protein] synthase